MSVLKRLLTHLPFFGPVYRQHLEYRKNASFPPGHWGSPIVSVDEIKERETEIWSGVNANAIAGVNLREKEQADLLKKFETYYSQLPFSDQKASGLRYYYKNEYYSYTDAIMLYSFIRHFKPQRIIEIGSGFSSALMLDVRERFFSDNLNLTFIEPFPDRLNSLMTEADRKNTRVVEKKIQDVPLNVFDELTSGDILFVDSSHVSKTGSDVNHILFKILPRLKKGVIVHVHDIFYPFEYPKEWVFGRRNWNECYLLHAFLQYNSAFRILLFSHYMHLQHKDSFAAMPLCSKNSGGNIWLEKTE